MVIRTIGLLVSVIISASMMMACGGSVDDNAPSTSMPEIVEVTVEVTVETISEVTREVEISKEVEVTRIVEVPVTVTSSPTPKISPTPTNTPLPTNTLPPTNTPLPTNTPAPTNTPSVTPIPSSTPDLSLTATVQAYGSLAAPKGNGFFQVGVNILPGKWRSTGTGNGCYWARLDANQGLINNHFGFAGGTVNVSSTDYEVEFDDCGMWEYVENEIPLLQPDASSPKGNGFFTVGVEIVPGQWRSTGTGDGCYWARLDHQQEILDNHFGNAGGTVTIFQSDYEIQFDDCGTWEYVGP